MPRNGISSSPTQSFTGSGTTICFCKKIHRALKPKGKLICEFGAHGNISIIENGFRRALQEIGVDYRSKFNFPTVEDFEDLLHQNGFVIEQIYDYDRPTPLKDGAQGLHHWAIQFFSA